MSIPGKLEIDRASRRDLDRWATLRDSDMRPHDILVEDLSATGCKLLVNLDLPIGMMVRLGLSGVSPRGGHIVRGSQPVYGCAFVEPMSDEDIRRAGQAETVVAAGFPGKPLPAKEPKHAPVAPSFARAALTDGKRRIPLWVDVVALFLILLFALHVWRTM